MCEAPKAAAKAASAVRGNASPVILRTERVQLDDISICADSGWRESDPREIAILKDKFKAGEYGNGILAIPSILCFDERPKVSTEDGRYLINNGRSTISALKMLKQAAAEAGEPELAASARELDWVAGELAEIFRSGVRCDFVQYSEDDRDVVIA